MSLIVALFCGHLIIDQSQAIRLTDPHNDFTPALDQEAVDIIAFTQNAGGFGSGKSSRIKTMDPVLNKKKKEADPKESMFSEEQAIAALSE